MDFRRGSLWSNRHKIVILLHTRIFRFYVQVIYQAAYNNSTKSLTDYLARCMSKRHESRKAAMHISTCCRHLASNRLVVARDSPARMTLT